MFTHRVFGSSITSELTSTLRLYGLYHSWHKLPMKCLNSHFLVYGPSRAPCRRLACCNISLVWSHNPQCHALNITFIYTTSHAPQLLPNARCPDSGNSFECSIFQLHNMYHEQSCISLPYRQQFL